MSRRNLYFGICIGLIILIIASLMLNIRFVTQNLEIMQKMMFDWRLLISAVILAFVFSKSKNYWLMMIGCAFVVAIIIQVVFYGLKAGLLTILLRAIVFLFVVYVIDYMRLIFKR